MVVSFNDKARKLLDDSNFATVATLNPHGEPQTSVVWITRDDDTLLFSITTDRQKARNLARDPRISVTVFDHDDPYTSVEVRGTAELDVDPAGELRTQLAHKYLGVDPPAEPDDVVRLVVRVKPEKVINYPG